MVTGIIYGDFFERLMHEAPVEIAPMLRNFITMANAAPYLKFG